MYKTIPEISEIISRENIIIGIKIHLSNVIFLKTLCTNSPHFPDYIIYRSNGLLKEPISIKFPSGSAM